MTDRNTTSELLRFATVLRKRIETATSIARGAQSSIARFIPGAAWSSAGSAAALITSTRKPRLKSGGKQPYDRPGRAALWAGEHDRYLAGLRFQPKSQPRSIAAASIFQSPLSLGGDAVRRVTFAPPRALPGRTSGDASWSNLQRKLTKLLGTTIASLAARRDETSARLGAAARRLEHETRRKFAAAALGHAGIGARENFPGAAPARVAFLRRTPLSQFLRAPLRDSQAPRLWPRQPMTTTDVPSAAVDSTIRTLARAGAPIVRLFTRCREALRTLVEAERNLYSHGTVGARSASRAVAAPQGFATRLSNRGAAALEGAGRISAGQAVAGLSGDMRLRLGPAAGAARRALNSADVPTVDRWRSALQSVPAAAPLVALGVPWMLMPTTASRMMAAAAAPAARIEHPARPGAANRTAREAIVINYAPKVMVNSEDAGGEEGLRRRVMEILEHHGRELHQALAREITRQQRMDFVTESPVHR